MKSREKLSVTVMTYNEESNIQKALESVLWADEVIVLDSFSTDRTVEICKKYTNKIINHEFVGYGRLRNIAIGQASYNWVLSLDADERISEPLKEEILHELEKGPSADAYSIPRKNFFLGYWVRHCGWYPGFRSMQLFHKEKGRYTEVLNGEHFEISPGGRRGYLKSPILHYPYRDLDRYLTKMDRSTTLNAQQMLKGGKKFRPLQLVIHPFSTFIQMYFLRQGFRDGHIGLILSVLYTYHTFVRYGKLWELTRKLGVKDAT